MAWSRFLSLGFWYLPSASADSLGKVLGLGHRGHGFEHSVQSSDVHSAGIGGAKMSRTYKLNEGLPVGQQALEDAEWHKSSTCNSDLGFAWTVNSAGAVREYPLKLYTNAAGQPSGIGVAIYNYMPEKQKKWVTESPVVGPMGSDVFHIDIAFRRNDKDWCEASSLGEDDIGDVLIVNPSGGANSKEIPITEEQAKDLRWQRGSCFNAMGWHYFLNTAGETLPTGYSNGGWLKSDVFPVVLMYHEGNLNAMFFASVTDQLPEDTSGGQTNMWDLRSLHDIMMCQNMCGHCLLTAQDGEPDGNWGTMHIFFKDQEGVGNVICPASAKCLPFTTMGCCEDDDLNAIAEEHDAQFSESSHTSQEWFWTLAGGGFGLLFGGGALFGFAVSRRAGSAHEVSEASSELPSAS